MIGVFVILGLVVLVGLPLLFVAGAARSAAYADRMAARGAAERAAEEPVRTSGVR